MFNFNYDKNQVDTQTEILISVADLRDLIQAASLKNSSDSITELNYILRSVGRKNHLTHKAFSVDDGSGFEISE